jgi:hypothetical protein
MTGVQFGFGQTCVTDPGFAVACRTVSLPFFDETAVKVSLDEKLVVCDSIGLLGFVPGL